MSEAAQTAEQERRGPIHILIVDDLADNRTLLRLDLEDELPNVKVTEAANGPQALEELQEGSFSVVICDLMMPEMDGFTVFKKADELLDAADLPPFVFLSANKQKEVAQEGLKIGAIDYLTKPYELPELIYKVRNLAKIKQLTDNLQASKKQLSKANDRLESLNHEKDEMLKIVSHDMRNPLNNIIGLASLLNTEETTPEEVTRMSEIIERSGEKLLNLVNSLLDVAKIESGAIQVNYSEFNLRDQICGVIESEQMLADKKNLELKLNVPDETVKVKLDKPKLDQILGNLLSNAIKFTKPGGTIKFTTELHEEDDKAYPGITIAVKDTGIGIPEEMQQHIFKKFGSHQRKGTDSEEGSGLGLSIVKHFVEIQGGTISVESEVDKGSEFTVRFPARN